MSEYMERPGFRPAHHGSDDDATTRILSTEDLDKALDRLVCPEDSYKNGVYWADLPFGERISWINKENNKETKSELAALWKMFKEDPLEPFRVYFYRYVVTGMG